MLYLTKNEGMQLQDWCIRHYRWGAVPVGHNSIIDLKDIPCKEVDMGETNAYHFSLKGKTKIFNVIR